MTRLPLNSSLSKQHSHKVRQSFGQKNTRPELGYGNGGGSAKMVRGGASYRLKSLRRNLIIRREAGELVAADCETRVNHSQWMENPRFEKMLKRQAGHLFDHSAKNVA